MMVRVDIAGLRSASWREYLARFFFGGVMTAIAGEIAHHWGPIVAGLFLAFPVIFPASVTLVEKHERERKQKKGLHGETRGRYAAADDAMGAAMGSVGLAGFAVMGWLLLPRYPVAMVLAAATLVWWLTAAFIWLLRKRRLKALNAIPNR